MGPFPLHSHVLVLVIISQLIGVIRFGECQLPSLLSCDDNSSFSQLDIPAALVYEKKKVTFSLTPRSSTCQTSTTFYSLKIPKFAESVAGTTIGIQYFMADGSLRVGNEYFTKDDYCLKKITKTKVDIEVCKTDCSARNSLCIPKCCELGKSMNSTQNRCSMSGQVNWLPNLFRSQSDTKMAKLEPGINPHYFVEFLKCSDPELWVPETVTQVGFKSMQFRVLKNGNTIYFDATLQKWRSLPAHSYCLDSISANGGARTDMVAVCSELIEGIESDNAENIVISIIYGVVMFISCGLYAVTIVVYIILWSKQKFHMYVVISYVTSLLLLHIFFGTSNMVQLKSMDDHLNGSLFCIVVGAATHLFILSTFCWLTLINMNLYSAFGGLNVPHAGSEGQGILRFIFFSLFSWGLPSAVVATGLILDNLNNDEPESPVLLGPNYGQTRCLISAEAEGWYLFYPIGVLVIINVGFFGLTVCRLLVYQRITRNVIGERSDKKWRIINVYLKILAIATFLWAFELTSWILMQESYVWYWLVMDILNLFQSAVIFTMFVCRKSIYEQLTKKFPVIIKCSSIFTSACCCGEEISE